MRRAKSTSDARAAAKPRQIWQRGDLFHVFSRYPRKRHAPKTDRLAGILRNGIVAPGCCPDGSVCSDLTIVVTGSSVPYDRIVFLHRFGSRSHIYTVCEPGRFFAFIDPKTPVLTPRDMGRNWAILCQDEVYVRERIGVEKLVGIAVHPADADSVLDEFLPEFERLGLPLYLWDGTVIWPRD